MDIGRPSRTALATAAARAAHLVVDRDPWILEDTLAALLLGGLADQLILAHRDPESATVHASIRVAITARSRYTEDRLTAAIERGVGQCVILGAGLDSLAYRSGLAQQSAFYEVDHPSTQSWKRERLSAVSIEIPRNVHLVPVDFTTDSLLESLEETGFDRSQPAFVSWLGVTQYLHEETIKTTLDAIATFAPGSELVMEYLVPAEMRDEAGQDLADFFMPRAASSGEPWLTFVAPGDVARWLHDRGLAVLEDVGRRQQVDATLWSRSDALVPHELGRLVRAVTGP